MNGSARPEDRDTVHDLVLGSCEGDKEIYGSVERSAYCAGDKIEKNEMGGACVTYGGRERCAQGFGGET